MSDMQTGGVGGFALIDVVDEIRIEHEPVGRKIGQVNEAARRLFLDQGFSATSMDAVARAAGVSKATLYSYFPSKEALFEHLIADECTILQQGFTVPSLGDGLEPALRQLAKEYVQLFMRQKKSSLVRVMANESSRFPDMCVRFYEIGPMATTRRVANFLLEAKSAGLITVPDAMVAATQFLSLIRGDLPLKAVLGITQHAIADIERELEAGLATFMRAYCTEPSVSA